MVFCKTCRFLWYNRGYLCKGNYICITKPTGVSVNWDTTEDLYADPIKRNAKNDCPSYKPKRWIQFKRWLCGKPN